MHAGNLEAMPQMRWKKQSSVCVILASKGYPGKYPTCETISGINSASKVSTIYHAGTKNKDGQILTNGGRVLGVSALGDSLSDASSAAYKACDMIQWQNKYCRRLTLEDSLSVCTCVFHLQACLMEHHLSQKVRILPSGTQKQAQL